MSAPIPQGLPRWLEILLAAVALSAALPLLAVAAILVRCTSAGPALFRQQRVGVGGKPFTLLKFRSMRGGRGGRVTAAGDLRVTAVGRVLRATKLDELPELLNILRGDMSFVGPRPEVAAFVDLDDPRWQRILSARPGLTDPVTLRLRNEEALLAELRELEPETTTESLYRRYLQPFKLRGYLEYLEQRSAMKDCAILFATARAILVPGSTSPPTSEELLSATRSREA